MTQTIEQLRDKHRKKRAALPVEVQEQNAVALRRHIESTPEYLTATHIAAYIAIRGEISLARLMEAGEKSAKQIYLPILREQSMFFAPWSIGTTLQKKGFGLLEPDVHSSTFIKPTDLDLILAPLVVFDSLCNRIGQGGGFYDRTFAHKRDAAEGSKPVLMGVAHDSQREQLLQPQSWDVTLDLVVSDFAIYRGA